MRIALVHRAKFPVSGYGGTERVVWWLAKGLKERGHQVVLSCAPGSQCPYAEVRRHDFGRPIEEQLADADILQLFETPPVEPTKPYVVNIGGNGRAGEVFWRNTVFVSKNHAERHGAEAFVYNGLDPDEYIYSERKCDRLLFLAKASWRVKNVKGAIAIAHSAHSSLDIVGGTRILLPRWRGIHWRGTVCGAAKAEFLAHARGLLFPVLWHEPFGIAVIEAMVSGTPVLATPFGSLAELVAPGTGFVCRTFAEFVEAVPRLSTLSAKLCRDYVLDSFTYRHMADAYLRAYELVLSGGYLNRDVPRSTVDAGALAVQRL